MSAKPTLLMGLPIPSRSSRFEAKESNLMTPEQFDALARLTRAREPARTAARRVLVDGICQADAAREQSMSASALGNSVRRYREFDALIRDAYKIKVLS